MTKLTYLFLDFGTILIPFIFSFHPKLKFNNKWRSTLISLLIVGIGFIVWDVYYTQLEVWGFNPKYLLGIKLFNLPIEEVLFFFCIPYACLFTYHCFKILLKPFTFKYFNPVVILIIAFLSIFGMIYYNNYYTGVTFFSLAIVLTYFNFINRQSWLPRFYTALLVLIIPFILVNGILTGTGLESEVVWYNPNEIIGLRILTIPIEDFFYGFLLLILNAVLFENFDYLNNQNRKPNTK